MRTAIQVILTFLLNSVWLAVAILAFAAICDWLLRGVAARYRHALWIVAFVLAALLPAWSAVRAPRAPALAAPDQVVARVEPVPTVTSRIITPGVEELEPSAAGQASSPETKPRVSSGFPSTIHVSRNFAIALASVYGLFVLVGFLRLFRSWRRTLSILKNSYDRELATNVRAVVDHCERVLGSKGTRVRVSTHVAVPITLGVLRPTIILPESLMREPDRELLMSAIGHETVHVVRRDYFWNLVFEVAYVPLSFHPATGLMRRRIRQTRELCCDEVVATKLLRPETYARSLMRLIGSAPLTPPLLSDTTIGLNQADVLEVRIMSLLKSRNSRRTRLSLLAATLVLLAPCLVAAKLALRLEVAAQEPAAILLEQEKQQKAAEEKLVRELTQQARQLELRLQETKGPQERAEIEKRLEEVKRNLELHARAVSDYHEQQAILEKYRAAIQEFANQSSKEMAELEKEAGEKYRAALQEYADKQSKEKIEYEKAREMLAKMESDYPRDEAAIREWRAKLLEFEKLSQSDRRVRLIHRVEPEYSPDAREKKIEGTVLLGVTIGPDGVPQNVQVKRSLYPSLDEKAVEAVRKWRFELSLKDGQPTSMNIDIEVVFKFYDREKELKEKTEGSGSGNGYGEVTRAFEARRKMEAEGQGQNDRARRHAELTQSAVITMDRAIQIATSQYPGKVLACSLGRDKEGPVFYHVVIVTTEGDKTTTKYVWVSALDGTILKSEDEKPREMKRSGTMIMGGVLNGKAVSLPLPRYPDIARAAKASGSVRVQVVIDGEGNVITANAVSGHPLLQSAAVDAARQAKFTTTRLSGEPVLVSGELIYNFVAQ